MKTFNILINFLLIYIKTVSYLNTITSSDLTYTVGIVEYHPIQHHDSITYNELCKENVQKYIELIEKCKQLDIVVFPEATITTLSAFNRRKDLIDLAIQFPKTSLFNPCQDGNVLDYIKDISCAAKRFHTYIVINTVEKIICEEDNEREDDKCKEKWNLYNANVIFDRNGNVIAKYRKFHLFNEPQNCRPKNPEYVTFKTDFGITFGTFICFDILFQEPAVELARKGIKHFVYPTMWFAEAPFLTALQMQDMWASGNDVTLLAANANDYKVGSGGSGIYQGLKGPRNITIVDNGSRLIVADVYKDLKNWVDENQDTLTPIEEDVEEIDRKGLERDGFRLILDNLKDYASFKIDGNTDKTYCHNDFCCQFKIELETKPNADSNSYYKYRAFVFSGIRSFHGPTKGGMEICAVVFCKDDTQESCGQRILPYSSIAWLTTFKKIEITTLFKEDKHRIQFPNTLLSSIEPIRPENYDFIQTRDATGGKKLKMDLLIPQTRLFTFGIFGRDFSRDGQQLGQSYDKIEL